MIYGLYASASGVLANSYRQDVIANNLANAETVGFKKDLALFQERRTAAATRGLSPHSHSNPILEPLGGGFAAGPTATLHTQGELEETGSPLNAAIAGAGFFAVRHQGEIRLTRAGEFLVNSEGQLVHQGGALALSDRRQPIDMRGEGKIQIATDGSITRGDKLVGKLGVFDVPNTALLVKQGGTLMSYPGLDSQMQRSSSTVMGRHLERSNVDPTTELTALMDAQRQLEANANMIRYQDQTLARLVNDVGKIG